MKAVLKFDLDNPDEIIAHLRCIKSLDMACVLFELQKNSKKKVLQSLENNNFKDKKYYEIVEGIFEGISELLEEHNINIDEIIE